MAGLDVNLVAPNGREICLPTGLFIDNEFVHGTARSIVSINPTDETEICTVHAASREDVDKAVKSARRALEDPDWRDLSGTQRGRLMSQWAECLERDRQILATLEAWDNGKPYLVALKSDLKDMVAVIRYYAGWADKLHGQTIPMDSGMQFSYTLKQPVGVCAQIIPWNYPLAMAAWKLGPALACGNTVVLKPAEQTPLSILFAAKLIKEAGFPPGVVNIINGYGGEAGHALAAHMDIDKIAFTGSTNIGKQIMKTASANLKDITLETGGKSPLLVFDDADLAQAAKWAHRGVMSNQGQVCIATSRILVQETVHNDFVELLEKTIREVSKVGDPFADDTFQGPQASKNQLDRVLHYIDAAKAEGAHLTMGGQRYQGANGKGFFIEPTVFTGVREEMTVYQEEVFGPLVVVSSFRTEEDAIRMANNSHYGLGAAVFTRNISRAHRVIQRLEVGMVSVNRSQGSDFRVPFGGTKQSGIGRELGEAGLSGYFQTKAVHINIGTLL